MTQPQCDGTEKHSHYKLDTGELFYHTHDHTINTKEFNRLHHHSPKEHEKFTYEELEKDLEIIKVPF